jgi:hypothetical protein
MGKAGILRDLLSGLDAGRRARRGWERYRCTAFPLSETCVSLSAYTSYASTLAGQRWHCIPVPGSELDALPRC